MDAFERASLRGEDVVRAERAIPLDRVLGLWRALDPASDPFGPIRTPPDALERLELAAELDGLMGESPWGLPIDAVADAYVLADEPDRAFELRLRALSRTPRWDGVLAARQLGRVARDLRARDPIALADELDGRAWRLDPTTRRGSVTLDDLEPLDDVGLVDLLLAEEYGALLGDHFSRPRRFALTCVRRGEPGMGRVPLYVTRNWALSLNGHAQALRLGVDAEFAASQANNLRLLDAIEATKAGAEALAASRKRTPNPYKENENTLIGLYQELAAKGDWSEVRRGLLSWRRKCRLYVGALLALRGDVLGTAYVERAGALAEELSDDGYEVGGDWALPRKVLARRAGDTTATWWAG